MAETLGSLIDKLTIVELRRWHTREVIQNPGAPAATRRECELRLEVIEEQRADLAQELADVWHAIVFEGKVPKVYRQYKMYNDAALRTASSRRAEAPKPLPKTG